MTIAIGRVVVGLSLFCASVLTGPVLVFAAGPAGINLGSSGSFVILAKTGISTTGSTVVIGDMGVSPAAATAITGFALTLPAMSAFSTSASVSGKVYAPDYADPTPANLTTAVLDMQTAYTDAAGRAAGVTELGAGNIGGLTLAPGVYKWGTGVTIPTDVTLSGSASDVWIFQVAQTLTVSSGVKVILSGGAQAANVFWVVGGQTTVGTGAAFTGTVLDQTAIVLTTGATLNGRALAQAAVTLDSNSVTASTASVTQTPTPTPTPAPTTTPTTNSTPTSIYTPSISSQGSPSSQGQAITLGDGQTVYVNSNGSFTSAQGRAMSSAVVSGSTVMGLGTLSVGQRVSSISVNLTQGGKGNDVTTLQQFLISQNAGVAAGALSTASATGFFGVLTRAALAEFQVRAGISPALGNFGPVTRAYLATHY